MGCAALTPHEAMVWMLVRHSTFEAAQAAVGGDVPEAHHAVGSPRHQAVQLRRATCQRRDACRFRMMHPSGMQM